MAAGRAEQVRAAVWPVAAALALLAACQWLTGTTIEYLVACAVATGIAAVALRDIPLARRLWPGLSTVALLLVVVVGAVTQWELFRIDAQWPSERSALVADGLASLDAEVDHALVSLRATAARALDAPQAATAAFAALPGSDDPGVDGGVVLYDHGQPLAWSGAIRVPTDQVADGVGVVRTPFYLALYAAETRGARRAVAVRLLDAVPPADRLSRPLAARVVRETGGAGFVFWLPTDSTRPRDAQPLLDRSRVLAYAQPAPITQGAMRVRTLERARLVAAATLALAMACFMVGTWRVGRKFRWRLVAVGVALLCTATAPLNAFSNYSRLFDASLYFTGTGGPLTANAGALLITGVLTLLALLAGIRRLSRGAPRLLWAGVVLAIAALGPFLLRDLARGIQIPAYGVNTALWLIWEVPIFLAACALLLAGAGAGSAALGGVRGLPAWVGPVLAGLAALLGPVTWEASGGWPWWYPIPWIVAIAALALARRSRTLVSSAAMVAALGATTLVWGATTRGRMALAERDVRGLSETDPYAVTLAERFGGAVLSSGPQTPSREWLLRLYATSELAAGGYPSWFSVWRGDTVPATTLRTAAFEVPGDQVREIVRQAQATRQIIELPLLARPAVEVALAVPTDSGVVVAVVASRTRLISGDPFAKLLGIEQPPEAQPPYVLQLGDYPAHVPAGPQQVEWRREATALHGDWVARTGIGASRVHVEVELRSVPALVQRGVLIVLLDLAIVWALWLGSVLADGAVMRWLRERERRWRRSYRTQLTLALFAFFMIPALAFAVWSYRQLADDAAQSRELLVRETLRAVAPGRQATEWLSSESRRLQAPLFLYHGGALVSASDTLLSALAPTGRLLDPPVHVALALQDEVTAISDESFGVAHALFGFRAIETEQGNDVLAAPARSDEAILDPRRSDLAVLVLFATALGALAAFWLSGIAARQLARPIGSLRKAALTLAAGGRAPVLEDNPTAEFRPVFAAFRRMATELEASKAATAHAQRVLAWGEMARQVAHEIKNPLTPIRLGVQHLKRARADQRVDFDRVLDENVTRILAEIDHLDEIARAFSRYGAGPSDRPNAEPTDVSDVLRDLVGLERMGDETIRWQLEGADERVQALARADELREVLLNLYENARLAGARTIGTTLSTDSVVRIVVQDDGQGIPADILPRVFEPHFSTRTSGSGLGLAISRRLIEAWGGRIWLQSAPGEGTRVQIELPRAG